mmetsp:Transcript_5754/g.13963  ORF Transcript_5754/g.13963 Transcript_5754/m.13963 type:complete len:166 (+) Transcript_5754:1706-2203(+)
MTTKVCWPKAPEIPNGSAELFPSKPAVELLDDFLSDTTSRFVELDFKGIYESCDLMATAVAIRRFLWLRDRNNSVTGIRSSSVGDRYKRTCLVPLEKKIKMLTTMLRRLFDNSNNKSEASGLEQGSLVRSIEKLRHRKDFPDLLKNLLRELTSLKITLAAAQPYC